MAYQALVAEATSATSRMELELGRLARRMKVIYSAERKAELTEKLVGYLPRLA